jgi:hypothetical protein
MIALGALYRRKKKLLRLHGCLKSYRELREKAIRHRCDANKVLIQRAAIRYTQRTIQKRALLVFIVVM